MPARPSTHETTLLAIDLLRRIPRHGGISAPQLHAALVEQGIQRDLRSIQRLLDTLSQHFDIERDDRSKPYTYRWKRHATAFSLAQLTPHESLLLRLAEQHLQHLLPTRLLRGMQDFFDQARRTLAHADSAQLEREWARKIRVVPTSQPLLPPAIDPDVLDAVSEALYANRWLQLDYQNASGTRRTYDVMPLGLAQQGPRLYLVCRFRDFDNERSLAVHRIHAASVSTLNFERPAGFDLRQYDADGRFGFGNGQHIELVFHITAEAGYHLRETPLSTDQEVTELADGQLRIRATVVDSAMLDWWLRGFGDAVGHIEKHKLKASPVTPAVHSAPLAPGGLR